MALGREMKRAIRRVSDLLAAYALNQGAELRDVRIDYRANESWGKLDFVLVSDVFAERDEYEAYKSAMTYLRHRLADDPDLISHVGLVIETFDQLAEGGLYAIGEDYKRVEPRDLTHRALIEVVTLVEVLVKERQWDEDIVRVLHKPPVCDSREVVLWVAAWKIPSEQVAETLVELVKSKLAVEPDRLTSIELKAVNGEPSGPKSLDETLASGYREYPRTPGLSVAQGH